MKVVLQTLLRARVASRTQSWGEGALPEAGERSVSAELGRYRLSSLSGCCPVRMLQCAQKVNPKTCDRVKARACSDILPSLKGGASQATHGITSPTLALEGTVRARSRIT